MSFVHPFGVAADIKAFGYTYVYWALRNEYGMKRRAALWMLWVARQYNRHITQQNLMTDILD